MGEVERMDLTMEDYQREARRTAIFRGKADPDPDGDRIGQRTDESLAYVALGLAQQAGDLAGEASKVLRDDSTRHLPDRRQARIKHKLGGVLWFVAAMCDEYGWSMEEVADRNLTMLAERKRAGLIKGEGWDR